MAFAMGVLTSQKNSWLGISVFLPQLKAWGLSPERFQGGQFSGAPGSAGSSHGKGGNYRLYRR